MAGGKKRAATVKAVVSPRLPARMKAKGGASAKTTPWPKQVAKAAKGAPKGQKPTPKRRAKANAAAATAHRNPTKWM